MTTTSPVTRGDTVALLGDFRAGYPSDGNLLIPEGTKGKVLGTGGGVITVEFPGPRIDTTLVVPLHGFDLRLVR